MTDHTPTKADTAPELIDAGKPDHAAAKRSEEDAPRRGRKESRFSLVFGIVFCVATWVPWSFRAAEAWEDGSVIGCSIAAMWFLITFMGIYGCLRNLGVVPPLRPPWCDPHW